MYKRMLTLLLIPVLVILMASLAMAQEDTRLHPHTADTLHCECAGTAVETGEHTCQDVSWTPISQALEAKGLSVSEADIGKLDSGWYYLDTDVMITAASKLGSRANDADTFPATVKNIRICLNGYNLESTSTPIFNVVYVQSSISFCDCSGTQDAQGNWSFDGCVNGGTANYGGVGYGYAGSRIDIYGGNFTGKASSNGGLFVTSNDACGDLNGDGKCTDSDKTLEGVNKGVLNIYAGQLTGSAVSSSGGAIAAFHTSVVNIYGGSITGGSATNGGVISVSGGTLNIYGGTISGGTASNVGGNIYAKWLNIYGGTITGGTAKYGGNLGGSITTITGGQITDGKVDEVSGYGGNIHIRASATNTLTISGGTISGGRARYGGNVSGSEFGNIEISGGNIFGGTARNGGNVYMGKGAAELSGGRITGGTPVGGSGGGVYITADTKLTVCGNIQIVDNTNSNLYLGGKNTFTVGTFAKGARVGVAPSEYINSLSTNTNLTEAVLEYIFADSPEATATISNGKLVFAVDSEGYAEKLAAMTVFDNDPDQALPMTITHKLVMEHMQAPLAEGKTEKKVLLIAYDAFRADAIENVVEQENSAIFAVAEMGGLYRSFCGAPDKTQQTATGAGWTTILTGGWQDLHAVRNNQSTMLNTVHTMIIDLAREGYTGAFVGNAMNSSILEDGSYATFFTKRWAADIDYVAAHGLDVTFTEPGEDEDTDAYMAQLLAQTEIPDVMMVYFEECDQVGHAAGYGNNYAAYRKAAQDSDAWGYNLVAGIQARPTYETEDWLIIVTTDHGGVFNNHGRQTEQERSTWIAVSKPVEMSEENLNYARTTADLEVEKHSHCVCGGSAKSVGDHTTCADAEWIPMSQALNAKGLSMTTANITKLDSGYYYLDGNVTITGNGYIGSSTVPKDLYICLNGYSMQKAEGRIVNGVYKDSSLNFCDCSGRQDDQGNWIFRGSVTGGVNPSATGSIAYTYAGSDLNIYGGNFYGRGGSTGGTFVIAHDACGDVNGNGTKNEEADKSHANVPKSYLSLYNGNLVGSTITGTGGVINCYHSSNVNIYGGTISGGTAKNGGLIYVNAGTLTMTGGVLSGGTATNQGGAIYVNTGKVNISGGTIKDCTSASYGGGLFVNSNAQATISGTAMFTGCSGSVGGNINVSGTLTMTGGIVEKGWPLSGDVEGGNVRVTGTFNMQGGIVRDGGANAEGKVVAKKGGNFQVFGVLNVSGGEISGGRSVGDGGNVALWDGELYMTGGVIKDGDSGKAGANVAANAPAGKASIVEISGGIISGGTTGTDRGSVSINLGTLKISGDTRVENGTVYLYAGKTITFGTMKQNASVTVQVADMTKPFTTNTAVASYLIAGNDGTYVKTAQDGLYISAAATVNGKYYKTLQEAVTAAGQTPVKLYENRTENLTVAELAYLDLNGFVLTGDITGAGELCLVDASGDAYQLPTGYVAGTISCELAQSFRVGEKRYLVLEEEVGYTSHRIYVGTTHMSLKPANNGVGYKAVFAGDSAVQAQLAQEGAFGFTLWVGENGQKATFAKNAADFESGKTVTLRLQNFDAEGYGEVPVYGQVFMKLADGTVLESAQYSYTLRQLMETLAGKASALTSEQLAAVSAMIEANPVMKNWDIEALIK